MKQKTIITLVVILAIAGAISYGIIWYRKRQSAKTETETGTNTNTNGTGSSTVNTGSTGTGYQLPKIESYAWWINKIGHANFPLSVGSKGVEVLKVQEVLNTLGAAKGLAKITEDGIWGNNTQARFKLLFPQYSAVTQFMFITDFDPNREILK